MTLCDQTKNLNTLFCNNSLFILENIELIKFDALSPKQKLPVDFYSLWIMAEGSGEVEIGERRYPLQNDKTVTFCNPGTLGQFHVTEHTKLLMYCLQFKVLKRKDSKNGIIYKEIHTPLFPNEVFELDSSLKIKSIAKELLSRLQCDAPANVLIVQKLFLEIMALISNVFLNCQGKNNCSVIELAKSFIEEHYYKDITREQLACMVGLSKEYFSRLFKKETGQNFTEYLTNIRIKKVEEHLLSSDACLREIAEQVGYKNEYYLSRKFKEVKGISPTMFQKMKHMSQ